MKHFISCLFKTVLITLLLVHPVFAQTELPDAEPQTETVTQKPVLKKIDTGEKKSYQKPILKKTDTGAKKSYQKPAPVIDTVHNLDFSLNGQYNYMLSHSRNINGYKLISPVRLASVWKSVGDTLIKERGELKEVRSKLQAISSSIKENSDGNTLNDTGNAAQISFLGVQFNQATYHIIVWMIIILLVVALVTVSATLKSKIDHVKSKAELYDEVSAEYQSYKIKANEKERKLAREIQNERNELEELKNKGKRK